MIALAFALTLSLAAEPEPAPAPSPAAADRGAGLSPAALAPGSLAFSAFIGAPEVGAGYRQGFSVLEFEALARFNYLELSGVAEAGVRLQAWKSERARIAPTLSLGLKLNSGARVFDPSNFAAVGLRPRLGVVASISASEVVQVVLTAEVPWAIALNVSGFQLTPVAGAGVEVMLSPTLSLLALGQGGVDVIKEPLGVPVVRPAWGLRLGVGYRVF
ncbi:MAG: hypothetical protein INH41_25995 [Myxococcaceae bacterium]|jgi:hypothetical protein|nr:hypothetical protein [Myxococcaceae bacterium]MCA3015854.1 hypothetical protein [Myxococcaceae bacterium]